MSSLAEVAKQVQEGRITQSIDAINRQLQAEGQSYSLYSNLAALHLQLGQTETAIAKCNRAISIDPFGFIAYFNRFLCYLSQDNSLLAWGDLQKALSCLNMIKGYQQKNMKLLNRAIYYCEQNAKAYLFRAKINEGKNNKLAENDYSAAIEYAPNLVEIYQQRALFYRKISKNEQFQKNLQIYLNLKRIGAKETGELPQNQNNQLNLNISQKIEEGVIQFQQLLARNKLKNSLANSDSRQLISKLPLNSLQSNIQKKDDEEMLLSDRPSEEGTARTLEIKKQEINFKKRVYEQRLNRNFQQIFHDENSQELNEEIAKLQKEIEAQGGKLSLDKEGEQLDISDPSNFLTAQIQKAIDQITKISNINDVKSVKSIKSANSHGSGHSKLSQNVQLTVQQFKRFNKFQIQIVSLQDLSDPKKKENGKIELKYKDRQYQTDWNKYDWRETFNISVELDAYEVQVHAILKGGIFRSSSNIGEGTINLLQKGQTKCILGNKQKKTAILYYKIKLI